MKALIYSRVSQDRSGGRSPAEQEAEARQVCQREGWDVAEVVTDTKGASRYSKGSRAGWLQVEKLLASGDVDVLVTWECSRAHRDLAAYAELRDLCVAHGVLWSYSGRTHDLTTADDRFKTGLDALLAEREVDTTRERILRAVRANAAQGRPHGRRLFGYERTYDPTSGLLTGQVPHPTEAEVVRRIFGDYLNGNGIRTIATSLNSEQVTTGSGARWNDSQVRRVLSNPAYTGLRVHRGEVVGEAAWEPLVSRGQYDAVQARLAHLKGTRQRKTTRLLTGVARCGVCQSKLLVGHDRNQRKVYQCRAGFHVARDMVLLDKWVSYLLLRWLEQGYADPADEPDPHQAVLAELTAQLDDYRAEAIAGRITAASFAAIEAGLRDRIRDVQREIAAKVIPLDFDLPDEPDEDWWESLTPEKRRAIVGAYVLVVTVDPLPVRGIRGVIDPKYVDVKIR